MIVCDRCNTEIEADGHYPLKVLIVKHFVRRQHEELPVDTEPVTVGPSPYGMDLCAGCADMLATKLGHDVAQFLKEGVKP